VTSSPTGRPDGRAARWAGQRERRRSAFVDAALEAIAEHGADVTTELIAEAAGVARTQVYKHFTDATDLHNAIAERAVELITTELAPLWNLSGTPKQMIDSAVGSHIRFMSERNNLYRYLNARDALADVKTTIGKHVTLLLEHYLGVFGMDTRVAETVAFGLVGMVDSSTARWLENPHGMDEDELAGLLGRWAWQILDDVLREHGVVLAPDAPLAFPDLKFAPDQA
jgi:AcrR family transcriptional regulator